MENRIKIAADSLLKKGNITREEHGELCKVAFKFKTLMDSLKTVGKKLPDHAEIINILKPIAYLGAIGIGGKELIVDPLVEKNKINTSFKIMQKKIPQLAEADQEQMKDYFNVVKTFSPKAASNPLVAGALVNKMMQFGGVDHKLVQDLSAIQAGMPQPKVAPTVVESVSKAVATPIIPSEKTTVEFDENKQITGFQLSKEK